MKPRGGFMLIFVLLVCGLILVLGLGFLSSHSPRYNASVYARSFAQARALAEAGLEDARVKLQKDPNFPPQLQASQTAFAYRRELTPVGSYLVTVDWTYALAPYYTVLVTSEGLAGADSGAPTGKCVLHAQFDFRPLNPASPHARDANYARLVNFWQDSQ